MSEAITPTEQVNDPNWALLCQQLEQMKTLGIAWHGFAPDEDAAEIEKKVAWEYKYISNREEFARKMEEIISLFRDHISAWFPNATNKEMQTVYQIGGFEPYLLIRNYRSFLIRNYRSFGYMTVIKFFSRQNGELTAEAEDGAFGTRIDLSGVVVAGGSVDSERLRLLQEFIGENEFQNNSQALKSKINNARDVLKEVASSRAKDVDAVVALYGILNPEYAEMQKLNPTEDVYQLRQAMIDVSQVLKLMKEQGSPITINDQAKALRHVDDAARVLDRKSAVNWEKEATIMRVGLASSNKDTVLAARKTWQEFLKRHGAEFSQETLKENEEVVIENAFQGSKISFLQELASYEKHNEQRVKDILTIYKSISPKKFSNALAKGKRAGIIKQPDESAVQAGVRLGQTLVDARNYAKEIEATPPEDAASRQRAIMAMETLQSRFLRDEWFDSSLWGPRIENVIDDVRAYYGKGDEIPGGEIKERIRSIAKLSYVSIDI